MEKTGLKISRLGLGGIPIQRTTPEGARNLVLELVKEGVNFIDTARGAICVSVLASKLSDTLSLDYQRSSHPTQYPAEIFRYCTRFSPRSPLAKIFRLAAYKRA